MASESKDFSESEIANRLTEETDETKRDSLNITAKEQEVDELKDSKNILEDAVESAPSKNTFKEFPLLYAFAGGLQVPVDNIMARYILTPNDTNDPSYTNLTLPYSVVCRQRYRNAGAKQKAQLIKEIRAHELLRSRALDGVRIHREFCNAIITPISSGELITLTKKQEQRLNQLLSENP